MVYNLFATKISTTGEPGVATGYLGNPTNPDNTSKSYANDGNSPSFPKYNSGVCHGGVDLQMQTGTSIYAMDGGVVSVTVIKKELVIKAGTHMVYMLL